MASSSSSSSSSSGGSSDSSSAHTYEHAGRQVEVSVHQSSSGGHQRHEVRVVVDGKEVDAKLLGDHPEQADDRELVSRVNALIDARRI